MASSIAGVCRVSRARARRAGIRGSAARAFRTASSSTAGHRAGSPQRRARPGDTGPSDRSRRSCRRARGVESVESGAAWPRAGRCSPDFRWTVPYRPAHRFRVDRRRPRRLREERQPAVAFLPQLATQAELEGEGAFLVVRSAEALREDSRRWTNSAPPGLAPRAARRPGTGRAERSIRTAAWARQRPTAAGTTRLLPLQGARSSRRQSGMPSGLVDAPRTDHRAGSL